LSFFKIISTGRILQSYITRPAEVDILLGNSEKAQRILDWHAKIDFKALCRMMMNADIERVRKA
jgi:GDPmannose 4,6-dehydratase